MDFVFVGFAFLLVLLFVIVVVVVIVCFFCVCVCSVCNASNFCFVHCTTDYIILYTLSIFVCVDILLTSSPQSNSCTASNLDGSVRCVTPQITTTRS